MRLIDADALRAWLKTIKLKDLSDGLGLCRVIFEDDFKEAIKHMPTDCIIDAEPVRHGHWDVVTVGTNFHTDRLCRNCKKTIKSNYWCYCPNCGAKMDEVNE